MGIKIGSGKYDIDIKNFARREKPNSGSITSISEDTAEASALPLPQLSRGEDKRGIQRTPSLFQSQCRAPSQPLSYLEKAKCRNVRAYSGLMWGAKASGLLVLSGAVVGSIFGVRMLKASGTESLLSLAADNLDNYFTTTGELSQDGQKMLSVLRLRNSGLVKKTLSGIESSVANGEKTLDQAVDDAEKEARRVQENGRKIFIASGVAAGVGILGLLILIPWAKDLHHRGSVLSRVRVQPSLSEEQIGGNIEMKF